MRNWQLLLAGFWGCVALGIAFRRELGVDVPGLANSSFLGLGLAVMLTLWNMARWNAGRTKAAGPNPLKPRSENTGYEYNPELDFQKMERERGEGPTAL